MYEESLLFTICYDYGMYMDIFQCSNLWQNETVCVFQTKICDGIPQCPDASDEDFDMCEEYFSPSANVKCPAYGIFNYYSIEIKAVRCNGIVECSDYSDEANCNTDQSTLLIFTLCGLAMLLVLSAAIIKLADTDAIPERLDDWMPFLCSFYIDFCYNML